MHYSVEIFQELIYLTNEVERERARKRSKKCVKWKGQQRNIKNSFSMFIIIIVQHWSGCSSVLVYHLFRIVSHFTHVRVWQLIYCAQMHQWTFFKILTRSEHNGTFGFVKRWPFTLIWDNSLNRLTNCQDWYLGEESWISVKVPITSAQINLFMRQPGTVGQAPRATPTVKDSFITV